jgi:hypothetical protein
MVAIVLDRTNRFIHTATIAIFRLWQVDGHDFLDRRALLVGA